MVVRRSIKAVLVLVAVAVAVAIVSNFLARSRSLPAPTDTDLLPEDVESRGTNFDHSEFKLGKLVFRVRSQTETLSAQGERQLQDVELLVFGEDGQVADAISGQEASYWVDQKKIELRKEVKIRLADGTEIFSDRLQGDLEREIIHIQEGFTFIRGNARGSGFDLTYRVAQRQIHAGRSFEMLIPTANGPLQIRSQSLDFELNTGRMDLTGGARIEGVQEQLSGQRILLELTPTNRIKRLESVGKAVFLNPPHNFSGGRILIDLDENGEGITRFRVESDTTGKGGDGARASYRQNTKGETQTVFADQMELLPWPGATSTTDIRLKSFLATGDVQFQSTAHALRDSRSDRISATFETTGRVNRILLQGSVHLNRFPPGEPAQSLRAPRVVYSFQQGRLSEMLAAGPVSLQFQGQSVERFLVAETSFRMGFDQGKPTQLDARGQVRLETIKGKQVSTLETPQLAADFRAGLLHQLQAGPGVYLSSRAPNSVWKSSSRQLDAEFEEGLLQEVIQRGDFLLVEEVAGGKTELQAADARFTVPSGTLQTFGQARGRLRQWDPAGGAPVVTQAARFRLVQKDRSVLAEGQVESEFTDPEAGETVRVSSGRMQGSESGDWVLYDQGVPLLITRQGRVTGREIRVRRSNGIVVVEGSVDSRLTQPAEDGDRQYRVQSERLRLNRQEGHALYTGQVRAQSEEMLLKAPFVQLFLAPESNDRVKEVRAWDGVVIEEPFRVAIGEKCFYFPAENLVRLLGSPAEVTDQQQGKASGPRLLFYPGTEKLIIESLTKKDP